MQKKSLAYRHNPLASSTHQLALLQASAHLPPFSAKLAEAGLSPLRRTALDILQVNIGKMCNQVCAHCHVDAGPERKEIMSRETMTECLQALDALAVSTVDITGGAPEMNPDFRWFVSELSTMGKRIIVRSNLTIILANRKFNDLPAFYKAHNVEVVSSLPFYRADRTDRQRGEGVFQQSIAALKMLNAEGYGQPDSRLTLNLVYNPSGAFLPANQEQLERDFKSELKAHHDVSFNKLFCITNMPISRYLEYLINSGNYEQYMDRLLQAFNPAAAKNVMCRNTLSVGWDGGLYDCDFNQMLGMAVTGTCKHIRDLGHSSVEGDLIAVNQHCYGCTAGTGSSCSGATI